jgi:hypothetical protein
MMDRVGYISLRGAAVARQSPIITQIVPKRLDFQYILWTAHGQHRLARVEGDVLSLCCVDARQPGSGCAV